MIVEPPCTALPARHVRPRRTRDADVVDAAVLRRSGGPRSRPSPCGSHGRHVRDRHRLAVALRRDRSEQRAVARRRRTSSAPISTGRSAFRSQPSRERRAGAEPDGRERRSRARSARSPTITPARRRRRTRAGALPLPAAVRQDEVEVVARVRAAAHSSTPLQAARRRASRRSLAARSAIASPGPAPRTTTSRCPPSVGHVHLVSVACRALDHRRAGRAERDLHGDLCERLGAADRRVADRIRGELLVRDDEPVVVARADPGVGEPDLLDDALHALRPRPRRRAAAAA